MSVPTVDSAEFIRRPGPKRKALGPLTFGERYPLSDEVWEQASGAYAAVLYSFQLVRLKAGRSMAVETAGEIRFMPRASGEELVRGGDGTDITEQMIHQMESLLAPEPEERRVEDDLEMETPRTVREHRRGKREEINQPWQL